ncbi:unnamed protein product [Auanema sp. JU1783]|nr:unnamed protein product [Auanema sp. JU1783]
MSFEAVPCMFRSVQGPAETEYLGLLIRPAPPGAQQNGNPPPQPLKIQGVYKSGAPITVSGEHAPKLLVPANVQVRVSSSSGEPTLCTEPSSSQGSNVQAATSTTGGPHLPHHVIGPNRSTSVSSTSPIADSSSSMSPAPTLCSMTSNNGHFRNQGDGRGNSRLSRQWHGSTVSDSSTTPDSGIQSIPNSPPGPHTLSPPNIEPCSSLCEEIPDEEDYADMPHLVAADEDEECVPGPSGIKEDLNETECDSTLPSAISITNTMDSKEIVEQLFQLDPEKAHAIARLISLKTQNRKPSEDDKEVMQRSRSRSAASDEGAELKVNSKNDPPQLSRVDTTFLDVPKKETLPDVTSPEESKRIYREAVRKHLRNQLNKLLENVRGSVGNLSITERNMKRSSAEAKKPFEVNWDAVRKRLKEGEKKEKSERKRRNSLSTRPKKEDVPVKQKRRKTISTHTEISTPKEIKNNNKLPTRTTSKRRSEDVPSYVDDFSFLDRRSESSNDDIKKSFCFTQLPWNSPIVQCGCSRGACTSDAECVNRALCVQCPQTCKASLCVNKKFWREDIARHLILATVRNKRVLKTRQAKRAGDFLGEFAGEVISYEEVLRRISTYRSDDVKPCVISLSATLYIDATKKGNIIRHVRHSCRPNCRLEVWSISGRRRAGLFSLFDIATGSEITVDMNGLLPFEQECSCGSSNCTGIIKRSRNSVLAATSDVSGTEKQEIKKHNIFLIRNRSSTIRCAKRRLLPLSSVVPESLYEKLRKVVEGLELRVRRIDGSLPYKALREYGALRRFLKDIRLGRTKDNIIDTFNYIMDRWLERLNDDDYDRVFQALSNHYLSSSLASDSREKKGGLGKSKNRDVNLAYLDVGEPVGSYDPDSAWPTGHAREGDDAVRCVCGSLEEDGQMMQCDECHFWLHTDCLETVDDSSDFQCKFCSGAIKDIPSTDVILAKQPEIRFIGCEYYKALNNNRNIQVRLNESVFVEKTTGDQHKKLLKLLVENVGKNKKKDVVGEEYRGFPPPSNEVIAHKLYDRKNLRAFRVERLFVAPTGHRFVFGFYYARPHETICDPNRIFHRNEIFATRFYDTLPLDSVVGRCIVLDPDVFCKGRPLFPMFKEEDVFLCEYQIDRQQRSFEKIPIRHRFPINTQPYVFQDFPEVKPLIRDFTPFLVSERGCNSASGRVSRSDSAKGEQHLKRQAELRLENAISNIALSNNKIEKRKKKV